MRKNLGSQHVGVQMISASTHLAVTSGVTCEVIKDGGTPAGSGGTLTHKTNGYWDYIPTAAETNAAHVAFVFNASGAVPATVQYYTSDEVKLECEAALAGSEITLGAAELAAIAQAVADNAEIDASLQTIGRINRASLSIIEGTIDGSTTPTNNVFKVALTAGASLPLVANQLKGLILKFPVDASVAAALRGQGTDIISNTTDTLTVTALTTIPVAGTKFVIE